MRTNNHALGETIQNARHKRSLSLTELARRVNISPQYLCDVEHGRRGLASGEVVAGLSSELSVNADYLDYLCSRFPEKERTSATMTEDQFLRAMTAFRKVRKGKP